MISTAIRLSIVAVIALGLTLSTAAQLEPPAGDEAAIRALVEQYFATYQTRDLEAATKFWSDKSPNLAPAKARLRDLFSLNSKIETSGLNVSRVQMENERATGVASIELSGIDAKSGKPSASLGKMNRVMSFVKEAEGWKLWRDVSAEEELAGRIVTAQNDADRRALLATEPSLATPELVRALSTEGQKLYNRGSYPQALAILQLSYQVSEQVGDKSGGGRTLMFTGHVYNLMGDYDTALAYYDRVIKVSEATGYKGGIARALVSIGTIQESRGQISSALASYFKALAEFEAVGDKRNTALTRSNMGVAYFDLKNYSQATEHYLKALALLEEVGIEELLPPVLNNLGNAYSIQGDFVSAQKYRERSLALAEKSGDRRTLATLENSIGDTLLHQGKPDEALVHFQKSLKIKEEIGAKEPITFSLNDIASAYCARGEYEKALEPAARAAALAVQLNNAENYRWARSTAGRALLALNRFDEARQALDDAIAATENLRRLAPSGDIDAQRYFEDRVSSYYRMIGLLVSQGKTAEALNYAERARARVLLDVLLSGKAQINKSLSQAEREEEARLRADLNSLNAQLRREGQSPKENSAALETLKARLEKARLSYEAFQTKLYSLRPELRVKRGEAQTVTLDQTGELLVDPGTALLEYSVSQDKSFLFVLTSSEKTGDVNTSGRAGTPVLKVYEIKITRKDLVERIRQLGQRIANNDIEYAQRSSELYDLLLGPARQQLRGKTRLIIVPDDVLWETPFHALRSSDGKFVIQNAAVSYAPSLTVLREIVRSRRAPASSSVLAMGNPTLGSQTISRARTVLGGSTFDPLPDAERMVREVGQIYGKRASKVYVGAEAREDLLKAEASGYSILQLASHGVISDASPMYSHIILAQGKDEKEDGLLEAWEIMQLDLKADLAVLSACATARGRFGAGEGVVGLTWALFVAGCPTTVVSQWNVESSATTELMIAFHRNLHSGLSKSEALRRASMTLMADKRYNHPFYWASFIVVGDGG